MRLGDDLDDDAVVEDGLDVDEFPEGHGDRLGVVVAQVEDGRVEFVAHPVGVVADQVGGEDVLAAAGGVEAAGARRRGADDLDGEAGVVEEGEEHELGLGHAAFPVAVELPAADGLEVVEEEGDGFDADGAPGDAEGVAELRVEDEDGVDGVVGARDLRVHEGGDVADREDLHAERGDLAGGVLHAVDGSPEGRGARADEHRAAELALGAGRGVGPRDGGGVRALVDGHGARGRGPGEVVLDGGAFGGGDGCLGVDQPVAEGLAEAGCADETRVLEGKQRGSSDVLVGGVLEDAPDLVGVERGVDGGGERRDA